MEFGRTRKGVIDRPVTNYYLKPGDASRYISHSIVRYRGEPFHALVDQDPESGKYIIKLFPDGNYQKVIHQIELDDPDLDISSPSLGYANIYQKRYNKLKVVYFRRMPYQSWKQGLTDHNTHCYSIDGSSYSYSTLSSPGFIDSLRGIFPDFKNAVQSLSDELTEIAISQNIALQARPSGLVIAFNRTKEFGHVPEKSIKSGDPYIVTKDDLVGWAIRRSNPEVDIRMEN